MLETEEVDADYFTPASSTSLARIFSNNTQIEDVVENSTLKYVPPLPAQVTFKSEEEKPTQCLYATALYAYEWLENTYVSKERVGFAIMRIIKTGLNNIVLYDSNKTTLSCLSLTPNVEINVKENVSISYYDNQQKYWSVYANPYELNKILDILKELNINLKYPVNAEIDPTGDDKTDNVPKHQVSVIARSEKPSEDKESDTDSSVNRRTKDSILKRMATMGQSVLPSTHLVLPQTSDSSDTNERHTQHKTRHKSSKTINKRNTDKHTTETEEIQESQIKKSTNNSISLPEMNTQLSQNAEQQVVAVKAMAIGKSQVNILPQSNDITLFLSEQRVSNSELRMNMSRMTEKLDLVLDKVKNIENVDRDVVSNNASQLQNEIIHKLLNEYEKKIKYYEDFIKFKRFDCETFENIDQINNKILRETKISNKNKCDCKKICEAKDIEITDLKQQIQILSTKINDNENLRNNENSLRKEISELKENLSKQNDQIFNLNKKLQNSLSKEEVSNKVKEIMNDTFQTISANFEDESNYTVPPSIKNIVASVIKKTTINFLKEL